MTAAHAAPEADRHNKTSISARWEECVFARFVALQPRPAPFACQPARTGPQDRPPNVRAGSRLAFFAPTYMRYTADNPETKTVVAVQRVMAKLYRKESLVFLLRTCCLRYLRVKQVAELTLGLNGDRESVELGDQHPAFLQDENPALCGRSMSSDRSSHLIDKARSSFAAGDIGTKENIPSWLAQEIRCDYPKPLLPLCKDPLGVRTERIDDILANLLAFKHDETARCI